MKIICLNNTKKGKEFEIIANGYFFLNYDLHRCKKGYSDTL